MSSKLETINLESAHSLPNLPNGVDSEAVRKQCALILAAPVFSQSKRYSSLLQYIVDRTLKGEYYDLKERMIGIHVFGRSPDYDTGTDATVRSAAVEVRKRLSRYFEAPEHHGELHICLPPGRYVAEFSLPSSQVPEPTPAVVAERPPRRRLYYAVACVVLCLLVGWFVVGSMGRGSAIQQFWSPLINSSGPVLIAIGAPAPHAPVAIQDASSASLNQFIASQANFPIAEMNAANSIDDFLGHYRKQALISLAQSTSLSDLRSGPSILLGASNVNQWQQRLGSSLHFQFRDDHATHSSWIEDASDPDNRKWAVAFQTPYRQVRNEYALITRTFDSSTGQWWFGIGGDTVLGTIAAQQMVTDPEAIKSLAAQLPRGWERKSLQAVIQFDMVDGSLGTSHIVKTYVW